jgi:DNA repair exonuclease SbcCD ATPase subunit
MPPSIPSSSFSITPATTIPFDPTRLPARNGSLSGASVLESASASKLADLENELREISSELAGSIRREMELEDLVERLQSELPMDAANRRTSDYFSDSGAGSIRYIYDANGKIDDLDKYRRAAEQERAQLKVELSQKWQEERARRAATESHVQILESQVNQVSYLFFWVWLS